MRRYTSSKLELHEQIERAVKMATTYLRRASDAIHWSEQRPITTWYWSLLDQSLVTAADIVEALPDDFFQDDMVDDFFGIGVGRQSINMSDGPLEQAEKVVVLLKQRRERTVLQRKIAALENTTGRTEEEAELYLAKAAELRGQLR